MPNVPDFKPIISITAGALAVVGGGVMAFKKLKKMRAAKKAAKRRKVAEDFYKKGWVAAKENRQSLGRD